MKGYIFDLDGVIVDTAKYHYQAWQKLAYELGFEFSEVHNERLKGVSRLDSLNIVLNVGQIYDISKKEKDALTERKNQYYLELIKNIDEKDILLGVKDYLIKIRKSGAKTALGSASKSGRMIIEKVGLTSLFDVIVDGNIISKAKPDPEVFLKAAELLKIDPQNCIVVEDAKAGVTAAKRAGMYCIGIGSMEQLQEANVVISGTEALLQLE